MLADRAEHPEPGETTPTPGAPARTRAVTPHFGGAASHGALAMGAMALGAIAIGRLAIGSLALKRGRACELHIGRLRIDELMIGRIVRHDEAGACRAREPMGHRGQFDPVRTDDGVRDRKGHAASA